MPPRQSRAARVLEHRLEVLVEHVDGARAGRVESVHQARVASRRLREVLPVVGAAVPARLLRRARRRVRRLTRALGPVRELDVALGILAEDVPAGDALAVEASGVRQRIDDERARRRAALLDALSPAEVADTLQAVQAVAHAIGGNEDPWRAELARRIDLRARAVKDAVGAAGLLYGSGTLHAVRIAAKKLRYAFELARDLGLAHTARAIDELKALQETLGRLHDLDVLATLATESAAPGGVSGAESPLANRLHGEARRFHAAYLEHRHVLIATTDAAAARVAAALRRRRQPRPRLARAS
jgi:CHAD domain-containing protein